MRWLWMQIRLLHVPVGKDDHRVEQAKMFLVQPALNVELVKAIKLEGPAMQQGRGVFNAQEIRR
jgi:hypothetical protein